MIKGVVIDITTAKLSKSLADAPAPSQQQDDELQVRPQASHTRLQAVRHNAKGSSQRCTRVSVRDPDAVLCWQDMALDEDVASQEPPPSPPASADHDESMPPVSPHARPVPRCVTCDSVAYLDCSHGSRCLC